MHEPMTPENAPFNLEKEVRKLARMREIEAWEGAIFYAARIFEHVMVNFTERRFGERPSNLCKAISIFENFDIFPLSFHYFAHALRLQGNGVRHGTIEAASPQEADSAVMLLYFLLRRLLDQPESDAGDRRISLQLAFAFIGECPVFPVYERLDAPSLDVHQVLEWEATNAGIYHSPTLVALIAERLIHGPTHDTVNPLDVAQRLLETGILSFPPDRVERLFQLLALVMKRRGALDQAIHILEHDCQKSDEETTGILASCYRQKWLETGLQKHLDHTLSLYQRNYSQKKTLYVGINLAATALYCKKLALARKTAQEIVDALLRRLTAVGLGPERLGDWDLATLAEAQLLCGRLADSRTLYRAYFERVRSRPGMFESTRGQLTRNLAALRFPCDWEGFLGRPDDDDRPLWKIGVSGHRRLPEDRRLGAALEQVFARLVEHHGDRRPAFVSPLAEGADRFVPLTFARWKGKPAPLFVEVPLELDDYLTDFEEETSKKEFLELLSQAESIGFPPKSRPRNDSYLEVGQRVVDQSDFLVFLWDGLPARGMGGTADIVAYATDRRKPHAIINTQDYSLRFPEKP